MPITRTKRELIAKLAAPFFARLSPQRWDFRKACGARPAVLSLQVMVYGMVLLLTSCSPRDLLTRRLATDLISSSQIFRTPQTFVLQTGVLSNKDYPSPEYLVLQHHGWISAAPVACTPGLVPPPCWDVLLTPSGVDAVRSALPAEPSDKASFSIPVARHQLVGITGIAKESNSADVEFSWRWIPLNEIGAALYSGDVRYNSVVGFRSYEDGWRITESTPRSNQSITDALKNAEPIP